VRKEIRKSRSPNYCGDHKRKMDIVTEWLYPVVL
jgi:hypothetical protein